MNYGPYLLAYFEFSSEKFDRPSSLSKDEMDKSTWGYRPNLINMKVQLDIFNFDWIRVVLYSASWILKILAYKVLSSAKKICQIEKASCYLIWISQKCHMIIVNSIAMDLIPYTLRTLVHSKNYPSKAIGSSLLLLSLLVFDYLEIELLGSRAIIEE